jgi:hypothetical protein
MLKIPFKINTSFKVLLLSTVLVIPFSSSGQNIPQSVTENVESEQSTTQNIHHIWNALVGKNVVAINNGHSTEVDYAAMKVQHDKLQAYLALLSAVTVEEFEGFSKSKQLAFLINAYNAWTVDLILTEYPDIESIKDIGNFFNSPWDREFIPLFGETLSLNNIEHDLIRGSEDGNGVPKYKEPRIHFAVNCASIGCPALRAEAYTAEKLDQQLEEQTINFLSDITRNRVEDNELKLSSIFKWYEEDFERGFRNSYNLSEFILLYAQSIKLNSTQTTKLKGDGMDIDFLDYNWKLNVRH